MNLLQDPVFTLSGGFRVSLPGLFAELSIRQDIGFPNLRPHQRPAWHMFLVQLGALALWATHRDDPPSDVNFWQAALRELTPEYSDDEPWRLTVSDLKKPAFLQPPAPDGINWIRISTPDELDMIITARNHDLKQATAIQCAIEDWVFALISLQTCEGFGGRGNYGIARMNGGSSSRPMLGLAPSVNGTSVDPSAWWLRDVSRLLAQRREHSNMSNCGKALLWCYNWPEGSYLDFRDLDPWFIEVCRRIRLDANDEETFAWRAPSKSTRIDAKSLKGNSGDPWAPIHRNEGKSLTLGSGDFDYKKIYDLLFSGDWKVPFLAKVGKNESGDMLLVAEAISRGNCKTEGFKSRIIPVPGPVVPFLAHKSQLAMIAKTQMEEIKIFSDSLRHAIALMAAAGIRENITRKHFSYADFTSKRFGLAADRIFFQHLWIGQKAKLIGDDAFSDARQEFCTNLLKSAKNELDATLLSVPCPAVLRPRAVSRAQRLFHQRIWQHYPELFKKGESSE